MKMNKLNNSDFYSIQELMSEIETEAKAKVSDYGTDILRQLWSDCVGEKISQLSSPISLSQVGVLTIGCINSLVANELFIERNNLLQILCEKSEKLGIKIKDLKIDIKNSIKG